MKVALYKNYRDTNGVICDVSVVLKAIKTGRWKNQINKYRETGDSTIKDSLPCFTVSGVFYPTKSVSDQKEQNGLISIDLDDVNWENDLFDKAIYETIEELLGDHLYTYFLSASGKGLCLLVKIKEYKDELQFKRIYHSIYTTIEPHLSKFCKVDYLPNVNRLRYVSFDESLYLNEGEVEEWTDELEPPQQIEMPKYKRPEKIILTLDGTMLTDQQKYDEIVNKYTEYTGTYGGNGQPRHDWVLGLARWLCRGGVDEGFAISTIISDYQNSSRPQVWNKEVERCVKSSYKSYSAEFGNYEPTKKFDYDDIKQASNVEEARKQLFLLIVDRQNYKKYLEENNKKTMFVEKEINFYKNLEKWL